MTFFIEVEYFYNVGGISKIHYYFLFNFASFVKFTFDNVIIIIPFNLLASDVHHHVYIRHNMFLFFSVLKNNRVYK